MNLNILSKTIDNLEKDIRYQANHQKRNSNTSKIKKLSKELHVIQSTLLKFMYSLYKPKSSHEFSKSRSIFKHYKVKIIFFHIAFQLFANFTVSTNLYSNQLNLQQLLEIFVAKSPSLKLAKENFIANQASTELLVSSTYPRVDLTANLVRMAQSKEHSQFAQLRDPPDTIYSSNFDWGLSIKTSVYSFGRFGHLYDGYKKTLEKTVSSFDHEVNNNVIELIGAYSNAFVAMHRLTSMKKTQRYADILLDFTRIEFNRGAISKIDLIRSQSFQAITKAQLAKSLQDLESSITRLKLILGLPKAKELTIDPQMKLEGSFFKVKDSEKKESLMVTLNRQRKEISQNNMDYYRKDYLPQLYGFVNIGATGNKNPTQGLEHEPSDLTKPSQFNYQIGLSLEWNLYTGHSTAENFRKAVAENAAAQIQLDFSITDQEINEKDARSSLETSRLLFTANKQSAEAAKLYFEKLDRDFKNGASSLHSVLEAEAEHSSLEQEVIKSYVNIIGSTANLKLVLGQKLNPEGSK